jgi:DNA-binding transcriptional LysR family regulator
VAGNRILDLTTRDADRSKSNGDVIHEAGLLDWDDLRFFLAVSRHRTLAAAAKHLRVTQSTVSRRITSLQASMGVRLLNRTPDGLVPTLAGESILHHAERVEAEALCAERAIAGHDDRLLGLVRVASSQLLSSQLLAASFADLHVHHRDILIEAFPEFAGDQLAAHEVDIALRLRRFEHPDLVVRTIGLLAFAFYGSVDYLARVGEPDLESECSGHQLITLLDEPGQCPQSAWLAEHAAKAVVTLKVDSYETQHCATYSGGGLAVLPRCLGDRDPKLRRLPTTAPPPAAEIWLGVHRENRRIPRVRLVLDCIAAAARSRAEALNPQENLPPI